MNAHFSNASLSAWKKERTKTFFWAILVLLFLAVLFGLGFAFIYGTVWISEKLLPFVELLSAIGLAAFILCLLSSTIFRGSRRFCGSGIASVSFVWGLALWMFATLVLFDRWGAAGMFFGFALMGYGTVP